MIQLSYVLSYITREELEQALKEKGMYNEAEIKGVIDEADVDNVSKRVKKLMKISCSCSRNDKLQM